MTLHFVRLALGNKTYKAKVTTEGCSDVDDFKDAIKNKLPHLLAVYDAAQLSLFQPDGTTEIDPGDFQFSKKNFFPNKHRLFSLRSRSTLTLYYISTWLPSNKRLHKIAKWLFFVALRPRILYASEVLDKRIGRCKKLIK
jgi:hypothetical protein